MVTAFGEYERLAAGSLGCSSLWLGRDHLLYVKGSGFLWPYQEEYRRIRFADIEAISLMAAPVRWWWWLLSVLAVALVCGSFGAVFASLGREDFQSNFWGNFAILVWLPPTALALGLVVAHLVAGRMCVCVLQTSQSRQVLRPVSRWRVGQKITERLAERIHQAQQGLPVRLEETLALGGTERVTSSLVVPGLALPALLAASCSGLGWILARWFGIEPLAPVSYGLTLVTFVLLMAALASVVRGFVPDGVRYSVLGALILSLLLAIMVPVMTVSIWGKVMDGWNAVNLLQGMAAFVHDGDLFRLGVVLTVAGGLLGCGVVGTVSWQVWRLRISRSI